jgi:hypothetical protein
MPAVSRLGRRWVSSARLPLCVVVAVLAAVAPGSHRATAATFEYASPTTFSTLNTGTTTSFSLADLSVTATRLSTFSGSNGLTLGRELITFPASSPSNPPWVAGARDMFRLRFNDQSNTTPDGSVTVEYAFSSPLPTSSYLVFADFDVRETLKIQAYDLANNLISFGSLSFARENGRDPTGATMTLPTWASEGGYSGVIAYGNNPIVSGSDPVVTVQSAVPIARVVYESDNDPYNNVNNNDLYFNFAVPTPVPEIDPAGFGNVVAVAAGVLALVRRRYGR